MSETKFKDALAEIKTLIEDVKNHNFSDYTTFKTVDGKFIHVQSEVITDGLSVLTGDSPGSNEAAPNGTYNLEDGTEVVIQDGIIAKFKPPQVVVVQEPAPVADPVVVADPAPAPVADPAPAMAFAEENLADGTMIFIEPTAEGVNEGGKAYSVGEDGLRSTEFVPAGTYELADGRQLIVGEEGMVVQIIEAITPAQAENNEGLLFEKLKGLENKFDEAIAKIEEKEKQITDIRTEFSEYKEKSESVIEKTFELVTQMAALPAVESPRKARGIRKESKKDRLVKGLAAIHENKN